MLRTILILSAYVCVSNVFGSLLAQDIPTDGDVVHTPWDASRSVQGVEVFQECLRNVEEIRSGQEAYFLETAQSQACTRSLQSLNLFCAVPGLWHMGRGKPGGRLLPVIVFATGVATIVSSVGTYVAARDQIRALKS
ncbi:MAG: hypothetical protein OXT67_00835 [Zetaproteobacteria bacterium]|nr:hypothetical protein [Zetaproteobacteria bacterium]